MDSSALENLVTSWIAYVEAEEGSLLSFTTDDLSIGELSSSFSVSWGKG